MPVQGPLSNQRLGEKYLLRELLGRGSYGEVYKAQNLSSPDRPLAIKVLREDLFQDPQFRMRFKREALILAGLRHPNIGVLPGLSCSILLCLAFLMIEKENV